MNKILRVANADKAILSLVNEGTMRNLSTTASRNVKVAVCGASGGIGQPLSLLLKQSPLKIYQRAFGGQSLKFGMGGLVRRYYSTKKEGEPVPTEEPVAAMPAGMVFEYTEGSRQSYQTSEIEKLLDYYIEKAEAAERWEFVAGFNAAIAVLKPEIRTRDNELVHARGIIGAIAARSGIDDIFLKKVKKFLPVKKPEQRYTGAQIQEAYVTFLATNDDFAVALKEEFPNLTNEALARNIRKIYGKLSKLDHTLLQLLRNVYTSEKLIEFVHMIPAILTKKQLEFIEKIIEIQVEICEDEDEDEDEDDEEN